MSKHLKILAGLGIVALVAFAALQTGLARRAFFELFAYVKNVEVVGPTIVRELPTDSPYQVWLEQAKAEIPVYEGLVINDVATITLPPWPQMGEGVTGLYLRFADYQQIDGRILEIPAGGKTVSQRHLYEKGIYFVSGSGFTILQQEGQPAQQVEWSPGDLLAVPLNVRHQHYNTGEGPVRMLLVSSFPMVLNVMGSEDFITDNPFAFTDRYDGATDYFKRAENEDDILVTANYVEDIRRITTQPYDIRGRGSETIQWLMASNTMLSLHVSEMPAKMFMKAHRHSSDAFILLLSGEGFSVTWPEGSYDDRVRVDWKAGTLFVPPTYWYHQHLNTGSSPARYLAINAPDLVRNMGLRFSDQLEVDVEEVRMEWAQEIEKSSGIQR